MKKRRLADEQIGYALRQVEAGKTTCGDLPEDGH